MSRDNFPAVLIPHGNAASSGERLLQWIIYHSSAATRWQEAGVHTSEFILWKSFSLWNIVIYAFILCSCTFYFCNALRARKVLSNLKHSTSNFVCIWISSPNLPHWSCRNLQSLVRLITSGGFSRRAVTQRSDADWHFLKVTGAVLSMQDKTILFNQASLTLLRKQGIDFQLL